MLKKTKKNGYYRLINQRTGKVKILKHYPSLDRDLGLTGILLYNIGKVKSVNDNLVPGYTDEGKLIGHNVLGRDIVLGTAQSIKKFPKDVITKLEHIILSHQSAQEKSSVTIYRFSEVLFVHYIYELDSGMNMILDAIENDQHLDLIGSQSIFRAELFKK